MAFSVTPTSGAGPYTLSLDVSNKVNIDGVNYGMIGYVSLTNGVCEPPTTQAQQIVVDSLLNLGVYERTVAVPVGSCAVYKLDIVDLNTAAVISTESAYIDNV